MTKTRNLWAGAAVAAMVSTGSLVAALSGAVAGDNSVPVKVGGEAEYDACGSVGAVYRLNPNGDNFLAVRSGPGSAHVMIDKLHSNDQVFLCDQNGAWFGIVYGPNNAECGVGSPIENRQPYSGGCTSGWVHSRYIKVIAG